jgi:hypothetical protein
MKAPRFEEIARRWAGKAEIYFVFSEEAHPRAQSSERLEQYAERMQALDRDGDGAITWAEYQAMPHASHDMFDAFDIDHDGVVQAHELLAARRVSQFANVDEAKTLDERVALGRAFRREVPGAIRVLVDPLDNHVARAYGEMPDSAFVIDRGGKLAMKLEWAAVPDVDAELAKLTGAAPPSAPAPPDLALVAPALAAAKASGQRVLVDFSAPGCAACAKMDATTLADADVQHALAGYQVVKLGVERDPAWALFEALDLGATPAFVVLEASGAVVARRQGYLARDAMLAFLSR